MNTKFQLKPKQAKKELFITGILSLPLRVNERALFFTSDKSVLTTPVQYIREVSMDGIVFETKNTIYHLTYSHQSSEIEVICA